MLKYVNPDFKISDLKIGDLVAVACNREIEAAFKKFIVESNDMYLEPLNPKWHEKSYHSVKDVNWLGYIGTYDILY